MKVDEVYSYDLWRVFEASSCQNSPGLGWRVASRGQQPSTGQWSGSSAWQEPQLLRVFNEKRSLAMVFSSWRILIGGWSLTTACRVLDPQPITRLLGWRSDP